MKWLTIYEMIKKRKNIIIEKTLKKLKNQVKYFTGEDSELESHRLKEFFLEEFECEKANDQERKLSSDNLAPFFFFKEIEKNKKIVICGGELEKEEPKLNWLLRNNEKYLIENPKKVLEIEKGKNWLSNILKKEETIFLFGKNWKKEIPINFKYNYKVIGLENGNRNSIPLGIIEEIKKKGEEKKKIETKILCDNSVENRKKEEIIIAFTTHEMNGNQIELILPSDLFLEKEGTFWNIFFERIKTRKIKGVNVDRTLKMFFKEGEVYETKTEKNYLRKKDKKREYQFDPLRLYKTEYLMKVKGEYLFEKIKREIKTERLLTFNYKKYIEKEMLITPERVKEWKKKKTYIKNERNEEKKIDKLSLFSQTEYEFYKRHKLGEEKKNYREWK